MTPATGRAGGGSAPLPLEQVRDIAGQAYLYGYPVVEMYRALYAQAIEAQDP